MPRRWAVHGYSCSSAIGRVAAAAGAVVLIAAATAPSSASAASAPHSHSASGAAPACDSAPVLLQVQRALVSADWQDQEGGGKVAAAILGVDLGGHGQGGAAGADTGGRLHGAAELLSVLQGQVGLLSSAGRSAAGAAWHRWSPPPELRERGFWEFFLSAHLGYWCFFASAVALAVALRAATLDRLLSKEHCLTGLLAFIALGLVYNVVIWISMGGQAGTAWLAGYLLEFVFLVENVFVFHVVAGSLRMTRKLMQQALWYVVWGQILFEMVFFMGLAVKLRRIHFLPYVLGVWLICCGVSAAADQGHEEPSAADSAAAKVFRACFGDKVLREMSKDGAAHAGAALTPLLAALCAFLAADFLLEIDVVLTKIEEIPNAYVAFTSSALASLALPELFFVSRGLLKRLTLLKYGIGLVLVLFGTQMLFAHVYVLPPLVACCIVAVVLLGSGILSYIWGRKRAATAAPVPFPPPSPMAEGGQGHALPATEGQEEGSKAGDDLAPPTVGDLRS